MVGHLLPNLDFREDGSEFWWGVFSLCLSLSVSYLSLSLSRVQREKQTNNSNNNNNGNNTKRERVTKEFVFLTSVCFQLFPKSPKRRHAALFLIIALLPCFCSSSSLPPRILLFLKKRAFLRRILLCACVLYPFIKSSGNICESAPAVRGI